MLDVMENMTALLTNATDLTASIGRAYTTVPEEVWNVPNPPTYPRLALAFYEVGGARIIPDANSSDIEILTLKCWFVSDQSIMEAVKFRDALRKKLHGKATDLQQQNVPVRFIESRGTRVGKVPNTDKFQAYCEFKIVA